MKIAFDNSVVIDILSQGDFFSDSFISYDIVQLREDEAYLSASSLNSIEYVLHRRGLSKIDAKRKTDALADLFYLIDVTESDVRLSRNSAMPDTEDALIAYGAKRAGMDLVLTRDIKGYKASPVPAMTPAEYVKTFCPPDYEYELTGLDEQPRYFTSALTH